VLNCPGRRLSIGAAKQHWIPNTAQHSTNTVNMNVTLQRIARTIRSDTVYSNSVKGRIKLIHIHECDDLHKYVQIESLSAVCQRVAIMHINTSRSSVVSSVHINPRDQQRPYTSFHLPRKTPIHIQFQVEIVFTISTNVRVFHTVCNRIRRRKTRSHRTCALVGKPRCDTVFRFLVRISIAANFWFVHMMILCATICFPGMSLQWLMRVPLMQQCNGAI
jgi:hypothetical protein